MTTVVTRRRARRDLGILAVWTTLVAFAVLLAIAEPRLLLQTIDRGARQAVASAGARTDVVVQGQVGMPRQGSDLPLIRPTAFESLAAAIPSRLPSAVASVYSGATTAVIGPTTLVFRVNGHLAAGANPVEAGLAMITSQNSKAMTVVSGRLPSAGSGTSAGSGSAPAVPVEVAIAQAAATAAGVKVGDILTVSSVTGLAASQSAGTLDVKVVGIVREAAGLAARTSPWQDIPGLWSPQVPPATDHFDPLVVGMLASPAGIAAASATYSDEFTGKIRLRLSASAFTSAIEARVASELSILRVHDERLVAKSDAQVTVQTEYLDALQSFPSQERAATAQMSIMIAGVLGVSIAVILLLSRLIVGRRMDEVALERARGASLVSIGLRALAESAIASAIATAIGTTLAWLLVPGPIVQPGVALVAIVFAVLSTPVQVVLQVRGQWAGRRIPANRRDRVDLVRRSAARRISIELTVLVIAVVALYSLTTRGLLETQTGGIDPLLASAPLLLAVAVTIVVLRLYRWPVRWLGALGRRSPGALGLLGAVRAQRSVAALPLLALTLAVALAVGGGLLVTTVRAGEETASWEHVGADVRVDSPVTDAQVATISKTKGVTDVASLFVKNGVQLRLGSGTNFATLIAVDDRFAGYVTRLPAGGTSTAGARALKLLAKPVPASDPLPVVVDSSFARQLTSRDIGAYYGLAFVPMHIVGTTKESPSGYLASPFIYVDRAALADRIHLDVTPRTVLVTGVGAEAAIAALHAKPSIVHTRTAWLEQRQHLALVSGVNTTMTLSSIAIALLAAIALIAIVLGGARERGRSLALLRTLGLRASLGWWLALSDLAPVVVAALVGGIAAGVGMVLLLEPAMGLRVLAGGLSEPQPTISFAVVGALAAGAILLLAFAVLVEVAFRRGDRLSEVLRVGESV
jgi:putative ABC transport system permease protein